MGHCTQHIAHKSILDNILPEHLLCHRWAYMRCKKKNKYFILKRAGKTNLTQWQLFRSKLLSVKIHIHTVMFLFNKGLYINKYEQLYMYLNSTPSLSSPHHLRRTWTSAGCLWIVQWIVGTETRRKHLRWPSTAGGRLVTTGILSWSDTVLGGVLVSRKKKTMKVTDYA